MKYTAIGLPAVEGGTIKQRVTSSKRIRKQLNNKSAADRVIQAERRATALRSQLAKARTALRKQPRSSALPGKIDRLSANLRRQRTEITRLRTALSAADLAAVQQLVDLERRQRAAQKKESFERSRTSRMGRSRGVRLTGGGPIRDR